jgi:hypothetical protein
MISNMLAVFMTLFCSTLVLADG